MFEITKDQYEKMVNWFKEDVEQQLGWTDIYITEERIFEIAKQKAKNLVNCMVRGAKYEPFE